MTVMSVFVYYFLHYLSTPNGSNIMVALGYYDFLGQNGVMVWTLILPHQESYDKNTFELKAHFHASELEGILCEKGKVLADINLMHMN